MQSYVPLMILFLVAAAITVGIFTLTSIIGPKNPTPEKMMPVRVRERDRRAAASSSRASSST